MDTRVMGILCSLSGQWTYKLSQDLSWNGGYQYANLTLYG